MYNQQILDAIVNENGVFNAFIFSKIESRKYELMFTSTGNKECLYEKDWWMNAANQLQTEINKIGGNDGLFEITKRESQSSSSSETMGVK